MAIVRFAHNDYSLIPAGAANVKIEHDRAGVLVWEGSKHIEGQGPNFLATWHTHVGLCIKDYERNGYDDSDFHMIVWNEEKQEPEDICFASTRGWSYPSYGSFADATDEVKAKYKAWERKRERSYKAARLIGERKELQSVARAAGLDYYVTVRDLKAVVAGDKWSKVVDLITNTRIRSGFKLSLRNQLVNWLKGDRKYNTPLSKRQWDCL